MKQLPVISLTLQFLFLLYTKKEISVYERTKTMHKKYCLLLSAFLFLSSASVSAENWIAYSGSDHIFIDTDSYRTQGNLSSIDICMTDEEKSTFSTLEFDPVKKQWRSISFLTRAKDGQVISAQKKGNPPPKWNPIVPGTVGKSIYHHYIETVMPDPQNSSWLLVFKDPATQSAYSIDRKRTTYKDGYAVFWLHAHYPHTENGPVNIIYRVKMNMAYKKIMTLSATEYAPDGKIKLHSAGSAKWSDIPSGVPLETVFLYLKEEVDSGRLSAPAK